MEISALLTLCVGNLPVTCDSPSQMPITQSFDIFFDLCLNNGWVNNRGAVDLRRHRAHYDVIGVIHYNRARSFLYLKIPNSLLVAKFNYYSV